jgi:hypothetical protein
MAHLDRECESKSVIVDEEKQSEVEGEMRLQHGD